PPPSALCAKRTGPRAAAVAVLSSWGAKRPSRPAAARRRAASVRCRRLHRSGGAGRDAADRLRILTPGARPSGARLDGYGAGAARRGGHGAHRSEVGATRARNLAAPLLGGSRRVPRPGAGGAEGPVF